jgi:hypothetical protein
VFLVTCCNYLNRRFPTALFTDIAPSRMFTTNSLCLIICPIHDWRLFFKIYKSDLSSFVLWKPSPFVILSAHFISNTGPCLDMTKYPNGIWTPVRSLAGCQLHYSGPTRIKQDQLNPSHAKVSNQSEIMGVSTCHNRCPLSKNIYAHLITSHGQPEPADDLHPSKIRQLATHSWNNTSYSMI